MHLSLFQPRGFLEKIKKQSSCVRDDQCYSIARLQQPAGLSDCFLSCQSPLLFCSEVFLFPNIYIGTAQRNQLIDFRRICSFDKGGEEFLSRCVQQKPINVVNVVVAIVARTGNRVNIGETRRQVPRIPSSSVLCLCCFDQKFFYFRTYTSVTITSEKAVTGSRPFLSFG